MPGTIRVPRQAARGQAPATLTVFVPLTTRRIRIPSRYSGPSNNVRFGTSLMFNSFQGNGTGTIGAVGRNAYRNDTLEVTFRDL